MGWRARKQLVSFGHGMVTSKSTVQSYYGAKLINRLFECKNKLDLELELGGERLERKIRKGRNCKELEIRRKVGAESMGLTHTLFFFYCNTFLLNCKAHKIYGGYELFICYSCLIVLICLLLFLFLCVVYFLSASPFFLILKIYVLNLCYICVKFMLQAQHCMPFTLCFIHVRLYLFILFFDGSTPPPFDLLLF